MRQPPLSWASNISAAESLGVQQHDKKLVTLLSVPHPAKLLHDMCKQNRRPAGGGEGEACTHDTPFRTSYGNHARGTNCRPKEASNA